MPAHRVMIGRRLRAARVSLGFEDSCFAVELGLPIERYRRIESGAVEPDLSTIIYISELTGKSIDFFLKGRASANTGA